MTAVSYDAEARHDGHLYAFTIPRLEVPICRVCGQKVFTEKVDEQINAALRSHLHHQSYVRESIEAGLADSREERTTLVEEARKQFGLTT